jgi:hypothetical protein
MLYVDVFISTLLFVVTGYLLFVIATDSTADSKTKRKILIGNVLQLLFVLIIMQSVWTVTKAADPPPITNYTRY